MYWEFEEIFAFVFFCAMLFCAICFVTACVYGAVIGALIFGFLFGCGVIFLWVDGFFFALFYGDE
jgi:hypothetical protein